MTHRLSGILTPSAGEVRILGDLVFTISVVNVAKLLIWDHKNQDHKLLIYLYIYICTQYNV